MPLTEGQSIVKAVPLCSATPRLAAKFTQWLQAATIYVTQKAFFQRTAMVANTFVNADPLNSHRQKDVTGKVKRSHTRQIHQTQMYWHVHLRGTAPMCFSFQMHLLEVGSVSIYSRCYMSAHHSRTVQYSRWCWWALRAWEVVTPSSAAPFTTLQGVPFEPLAPLGWWTGTENGSLHLAKWQPLTMRPILFDTGQTPKTFCAPVASCWPNTPVPLQRRVNKGKTGMEAGTGRDGVMEWCWYRAWQPATQQALTAQTYNNNNTNAGMQQLTWKPQETSGCLIAPPAVISFYNQHMQIGIRWQPINHTLATICPANLHVPADVSRSQMARRHAKVPATQAYETHEKRSISICPRGREQLELIPLHK